MPARPDRLPMNLYRRASNVPRVDPHASRVPARRMGTPVVRPQKVPNNVFAGRDGRVYRRDQGGWKVNQGRSWVSAPVEVKPPATLTPGAGNVGRTESNPNWPPPPPPPPPISPQRFPQRSPAAPAPAEPPRVAPPPQPQPRPQPQPQPQPGNLEREFRGRERGAAPAPARAPEKEPQKERPDRKP
jgi:hypothetical protein